MSNPGVHQTHCCVHHGCKYGSEICPVVRGAVKQEFPCESCGPATDWEVLPRNRKEDLIRLLIMESEGGGWIDPDMFEDDPEEAQAQVAAIEALVKKLAGELENEVGDAS